MTNEFPVVVTELGYRPRDDSAEYAHAVTDDLSHAADGARLAHLT